MATEEAIWGLVHACPVDVNGSRGDAWVAYGLYMGWSKLTEGQRKPEDDERLHKLIRRFRDAP